MLKWEVVKVFEAQLLGITAEADKQKTVAECIKSYTTDVYVYESISNIV